MLYIIPGPLAFVELSGYPLHPYSYALKCAFRGKSVVPNAICVNDER
jgi:hypothetical protein